jgi:hypothetical protein
MFTNFSGKQRRIYGGKGVIPLEGQDGCEENVFAFISGKHHHLKDAK